MADVSDYLMSGPDAENYYRQTERKHFPGGSSTGVGSEFRDGRAPNLLSLLELAAAQRGGLDGHDHELLGEPGRPGTYYLAVEVTGVNGAMASRDLPGGTGLLVLSSKDGVPPDYLVFGVDRPEVGVGTLVMADERGADGEPTGRRVLITCHPGLPMPPAGQHRKGTAENTVLKATEVAPDETVLVGDISHVSSSTVDVLSTLMGDKIVDNADMGKALSWVSHLPDDLRAKVQSVLHETWRIDDGVYEDSYNTDLAEDWNRTAAAELADLLKEHRPRTGQRDRVKMPAHLPAVSSRAPGMRT